jgi:hypothetical protein
VKTKSTVRDHADYESDVLPLVRQAGSAWVATWRDSLVKEGRAMKGGFPGTKAEARAWVRSTVAPALAGRGLPTPTAEAAACAARDLYAAARKAWLLEAL